MLKKFIVKFLFNKAIRGSKYFKNFPSGYGLDDNERSIEIEFIRHFYRGEKKVLDVGCTFSEPRWFEMIKSLHIPDLVGIDLVAKDKLAGYKKIIKGDIRETSFEDNVFDAIFCVSTLEHVGMDNTIYGLGVEDDHVSQLDAMREMYRILKPKGKLLLTLPFGKFQNHGGFIQYDLAALGHIVVNSDFKTKSLCTFRLNRYWHFCKLSECSDVKYQEEKHRAGAVVCLILGK